MKFLKIPLFAIAVCCLGCKQNAKPVVNRTPVKPVVAKVVIPVKSDTVVSTAANEKDRQDIQKLIREMMVWAEGSKTVPDLLPFVVVKKDTVIGFDLDKLKGIDDSLKSTGFFAKEFIDNYNLIIQTLDKRMKSRDIEPFSTAELPPFGFHTDADSWCDCQDEPVEVPAGYNHLEVHIVKLNDQSGKMYWTWGGLPKDVNPDWKDVHYRFNAQKEDGKWKIAYLEGFDIKLAQGAK